MLNIAETALKNDDFTILVDALSSTGLIGILKGAGPFTLFAPDDTAFTKIDPVMMADLIADTLNLSKVLFYHAVNGKYMQNDLTGLTSLSSMEGSDIFIGISRRGEIKVNEAIITFADIECGNGVIHGIDSVIFPSVFEF